MAFVTPVIWLSVTLIGPLTPAPDRTRTPSVVPLIKLFVTVNPYGDLAHTPAAATSIWLLLTVTLAEAALADVVTPMPTIEMLLPVTVAAAVL